MSLSNGAERQAMLPDSHPWSLPPSEPELWVFFMRSADFVGNSISALTDGDWSHCGLMLYTPNNDAVVYEAIFAKNAIVKRDARERFRAFSAESAKNRLMLVPLRHAGIFCYGEIAVDRVIEYAESCVKDVTYGRWQLLGMALAQRLGITALVGKSATKQVCSELVARCLGGGDHETDAPVICDLRDSRHNTYNLVTPNSVARRLMDITAGYGPYTRPFRPQLSPIFSAPASAAS